MDFLDMTDATIEEIYQAIGQLIVAELPEAWISATTTAEIEDDDSGLTYGAYVPVNEPDQPRDFATGYRFYLLFDELRRRFRKPGDAPWIKAQFTLQRNGHFDLEFTYPDEKPADNAGIVG